MDCFTIRWGELCIRNAFLSAVDASFLFPANSLLTQCFFLKHGGVAVNREGHLKSALRMVTYKTSYDLVFEFSSLALVKGDIFDEFSLPLLHMILIA